MDTASPLNKIRPRINRFTRTGSGSMKHCDNAAIMDIGQEKRV